jgi:hypothetical protein
MDMFLCETNDLSIVSTGISTFAVKIKRVSNMYSATSATPREENESNLTNIANYGVLKN